MAMAMPVVACESEVHGIESATGHLMIPVRSDVGM